MPLPVCESYTLASSHHTGGLENAETCANCGRAIVEVAILSDSRGNSHRVGMDCAQTLTNPLDYDRHAGHFQDAKTFAAALRKSRKLNPGAPVAVHEYGAGVGYYRQGGFLVTIGAPDALGYLSRNLPEHLRPYILPLLKGAI